VGSLDLDRGGDFVVVSAECADPGRESLGDVERRLRRHDLTSAWRLDHDHQDGLVGLRTGFGMAELVDALADLTSGRVGVSAPFRALDEAPAARRQARLACLAATPGSRAVLRFEEHPLGVLLASAPERTEALVHSVLGRVLELPREDSSLTIETVRTWLDADGSTSAAAERLFLHRNTVRYRLSRFEELTGRKLSRPSDTTEVFVALEGARILGSG
jgi:DNA-binding PucR family transcriptional regulator